MKQPGLYVVHAAAVRDATGVNARPGAVMVYGGKVHTAGDCASFDRELLDRAEHIDMREYLILPQLVNAHTHLELTDIGPQPYDPAGGFVGWVKRLRSLAPSSDQDRVDSAKRGAAMCRESGVQAVGDITCSRNVATAVGASGLWGFSYRELFGLGPPYDQQALKTIQDFREDLDPEAGIIRIGLQPHAPYSAGPAIFEASSGLTRRACTHLAETKEEADFVGKLTGPLYDYVRSLGRWDSRFAEQYGQGLSPVQWMEPYLRAGFPEGGWFSNWLVAHCNYVDDNDIRLLADTHTNVAYCPIASEYFGHTNHRYRDMLDAGINVCLGTDSIVCADPEDPQPMCIFNAMRRLYQRDRTDPGILLAMATINGAKALMMTPTVATLQANAWSPLTCLKVDPRDSIDPLIQGLSSRVPVESLSFDSLPPQKSGIYDGCDTHPWLHRSGHHGRADGEEPV